MKFKTIFEDDQILVLDKPAGLVVNRSETVKEETLQDQLAGYFHLEPGNLGIGERAGIVHRLDRETSGVLVVAKDQKTFDFLQKQFKDRKVAKEYIALVHGLVKDKSGTIEAKIGRIGKFGKFRVVNSSTDMGREAQTDFEVTGYYEFKPDYFNVLSHKSKLARSRINYLENHAKNYTLISFFPKTGRTHQVRVHAKSVGYPLVSDSIYTPAKLLKFDLFWCGRLFLHSKKIAFVKPSGEKVVFEALLPYDLRKALDFLKKLPHA